MVDRVCVAIIFLKVLRVLAQEMNMIIKRNYIFLQTKQSSKFSVDLKQQTFMRYF